MIVYVANVSNCLQLFPNLMFCYNSYEMRSRAQISEMHKFLTKWHSKYKTMTL